MLNHTKFCDQNLQFVVTKNHEKRCSAESRRRRKAVSQVMTRPHNIKKKKRKQKCLETKHLKISLYDSSIKSIQIKV
ncbi:hypothetical protein HanIR_Chr17g0901641 [Helianthus annuus]|nr:hypothetical protein HanIR_Chr17g0901641 [Helianthus annuus]